jgi:AbrB family looped-hinge helix DNA binding protein
MNREAASQSRRRGLNVLPFAIGAMPFHNGIVNTIVTIDKAGRVVIPKEIRDELRLEAGDTLAIESAGEHVTLRPVHGGTALQKERGVWVFRGGKRLSLDEANQLVQETRERRDHRNSGERNR